MTPLCKIYSRPLFWAPATAVIVAAVLLALVPREPAYQRKPLSFWLDQVHATLVSTNTGQYYLAFPPYGNNAFSGFVPRWSPPVMTVTHKVSAGWQSYSFNGDLDNSEVVTEFASPQERPIIALGPQCLKTLLLRLRSRETPVTRLRTYLRAGASKFHYYKSSWVYDSPEIRRGQAVTALIWLGARAKPILPEVIALAKTDSDPGVRASALEVVRRLSPDDYERIKVGQKR